MIFSKRWRTIRRIKKDAILVARLLGTRNLLQNSSHTFEYSMIKIMVFTASSSNDNIDIQVIRKNTLVKVFDGWNDERTYRYKPGQWEGVPGVPRGRGEKEGRCQERDGPGEQVRAYRRHRHLRGRRMTTAETTPVSWGVRFSGLFGSSMT